MAHIYRIFNVVTDHFYIGSAVKFKRRRWEHLDALKKNTHHCVALQAAWNTYGVDAFDFEILEEVEDSQVLQIEDIYLARFAGQQICYNTAYTTMQPPASASVDTREKIRAAMLRIYADKTQHPRIGKQHTEETKQKIRDAKLANPTRAWLGKERDAATRKKIGDTQRGVKKGERTFTPEGLAKAQESMRRNAKVSVPAEFAVVYAKFPVGVQERYDFTGAVYTGALIRIAGIKCNIHGEFSQYAAQLRKGRGCPSCGAALRGDKKSAEMIQKWGDPVERKNMLAARKK